MAEEYSVNFQAEVMLSLQTLIRKSNEHDKRFDIIDERFAIQGEQLRIVDGRLSDVVTQTRSAEVAEFSRETMVSGNVVSGEFYIYTYKNYYEWRIRRQI